MPVLCPICSRESHVIRNCLLLTEIPPHLVVTPYRYVVRRFVKELIPKKRQSLAV
jgi:hypothetical protein